MAKVVNRSDFLKLPVGTIYCKGVRWAFEGLCIKDDSLASNDWFCLDMAWPDASDSGVANDILEQSLATGSSFRCDEDFGRDGMFQDGAVFLIFEKADLEKLRSRIDIAISAGGEA